MKKIIQILLVSLLTFISLPAAEDFSNTEYWDSYCEGFKSHPEDKERYKICTKYKEYKINNSQDKINGLKDELEALKGNLEEAQKKLEEFLEQISILQSDIDKLNSEIKILEEKIVKLEADIKEKEVEVEELNQRILSKMEASQSLMHFNPFLDFLLGAINFDDMLRRAYGLETIAKHDEQTRIKLKDIIKSLEADNTILKEDKTKLDFQKKEVVSKQDDLKALKDFQQDIVNRTNAQIDETLSNLEEEYQNYDDLISSSDLECIPSSEGFIRPLPGASISAGVWHYPESFGGGVHLGVDYAVKKGSPVVAPASGVVLISSDGCGDGWLGNSCGYQNGGEIYGGNQIYLIVAAGGNVYGVIFCHLLLNSLTVSKGDVVVQGQQIAQVGSSGNSTGPHSHVELFYLGEGELEDIPDYLKNNYTKSFNCGWGSTALRRLCENGVGAPCRLNPANYL